MVAGDYLCLVGGKEVILGMPNYRDAKNVLLVDLYSSKRLTSELKSFTLALPLTSIPSAVDLVRRDTLMVFGDGDEACLIVVQPIAAVRNDMGFARKPKAKTANTHLGVAPALGTRLQHNPCRWESPYVVVELCEAPR